MRNKFKLDEKVGVYGKDTKVYVVQGIYEKLGSKNGRLKLDIRYDLRDEKTGEVIEAVEEDVHKLRKLKKTDEQIEIHNNIVDAALDEYNDKMTMYEVFNDDNYKREAENIIAALKDYVTEFHGR